MESNTPVSGSILTLIVFASTRRRLMALDLLLVFPTAALLDLRLALVEVLVVNAVVVVLIVVVVVGARRETASDMGNRLCLRWMWKTATLTATPPLLPLPRLLVLQ